MCRKPHDRVEEGTADGQPRITTAVAPEKKMVDRKQCGNFVFFPEECRRPPHENEKHAI